MARRVVKKMDCGACQNALYDNAPGAHAFFCKKRGPLTAEFVRKNFSTGGADITQHGDGVRISASGAWFGRVQTLLGDMGGMGFRMRWLPGRRVLSATRR